MRVESARAGDYGSFKIILYNKDHTLEQILEIRDAKAQDKSEQNSEIAIKMRFKDKLFAKYSNFVNGLREDNYEGKMPYHVLRSAR